MEKWRLPYQCTNQLHLPKNGCERLKLVSKTALRKWNSKNRITFSDVPLHQNSPPEQPKKSCSIFFPTRFSRNFLQMVNTIVSDTGQYATPKLTKYQRCNLIIQIHQFTIKIDKININLLYECVKIVEFNFNSHVFHVMYQETRFLNQDACFLSNGPDKKERTKTQ